MLKDISHQRGQIHTIDELNEAERHLAGVLWSAAHTVVECCRDHLADLRATLVDAPPSIELMQEDRLIRDALGRAEAAENMAVGLVVQRPVDYRADIRTLSQAVAEWDVQAHRALLTNRSTSCLALIARHESLVQSGFAIAVGSAARNGAVDPHTASRLDPVLSQLSDSWEGVAQRVRDLSWGAEAVPRATLEAAHGLKRAFSLVVFEGPADRKGEALSALNSHLASSVALAAAARELVSGGELTAPARAVNRVLLEGAESSAMRSPVSPVDLLRGVSIAIPPEARGHLQGSVDDVFRQSMEAMHRASGLDGSRLDSVTAHPELGKAMHPTDLAVPGTGREARPLSPPR
ncbi:hypothetical protein ASD11_14520 [Aeromicrobium sp. Root495]|nr:hypothetical protein ASD11_14520 [Aeromicrobium sp. Root495]